MAATFEPNREGIQAALSSEAMYREMERRAGRGKAFAMSIAPVDTGQYKYGAHVLNDKHDPHGHRRRRFVEGFQALPKDMVGGIEVTRFQTPEGWAGARVTARAPHSVFVEYGTRYMKAQHVMARSIDAMR